MTPLVELKNITKKFNGVIANDNISCSFMPGEIHALLGENGAGKSTLVNVLYGLYQLDGGSILIDGKEVIISSPPDAIANGIGMVHQHFMLIPTFTVAENIVLGSEPEPFRLNQKTINKIAEDLAAKYQMKITPEAYVQDISIGMAQKVEILKALYRGARLLILDEPTAVLTPQEAVELGQIMRNLTQQGNTIVFITHKLKEVLSFSDTITVIRRGKWIATLPTKDATQLQLAEMMVGRHVSLQVEKEAANPGETVLELQNVSCKNDRDIDALNQINLCVKRGEIVGIAGIEGNGQSELVDIIAGLRSVSSGALIIGGEKIEKASPKTMIEKGVSCIPEDRHKYGLILQQSIEENLIIKDVKKQAYSTKCGRIKWKEVKSRAAKQIEQYDIRTSSQSIPVSSLSGGNQQKIVIARELEKNPQVLVAAQPTRGLDIGAIEFVHKTIIDARDRGVGVLLVSFELDEVMSVSDRILVIYEGKIVGEFRQGNVTEEQLGVLMAGGSVF